MSLYRLGAVRAYAYARVSTEEQSVSGLGVDAQLAAAHGAIEVRGWTLAGSVIDAAVSGDMVRACW